MTGGVAVAILVLSALALSRFRVNSTWLVGGVSDGFQAREFDVGPHSCTNQHPALVPRSRISF